MATTTQTQWAQSPFAPMAALLVDATATAIDGLRSLELNPVKTLLLWQARTETRRHLSRLDDRLLADMGMHRADVLDESTKPVWKA